MKTAVWINPCPPSPDVTQKTVQPLRRFFSEAHGVFRWNEYMTNELITTAVADSKKSTPETKLPIMWIGSLAFLCGLIAEAAYNLAHHPELWDAITGPTT